MQTATHTAARTPTKVEAPQKGSDMQFYSPIGIQAVAAAADQMRRARDEALRADANRKQTPSVLRDDDEDLA